MDRIYLRKHDSEGYSFRYLIFLLTQLILFSSCEKQLDLAPLGNLTDATYYNTAEDAKAAVGACYGSISNMDVFLDLATTDDAVPFLTGDANRPLLWRYDITPANNYLRFYPSGYAGINRSNIVLDRLPGIKMDEGLKTRFLAEAKFLRALHYFNLVRLYGGVPIVTKETIGLNGLEIPRATSAEVYALIESDLKEAEVNLPKTYSANDVGRATQGAATAILAKVHLTMAGTDRSSIHWRQALDKAKAVMDLGIYDLYDNYADVFSLSSRGGKENIFEIQYLTDIKGHSLGRAYGVRSAPIYPGGGAGTARPTASLYNAYATNDERKAVTFITSYTFNGIVNQLSITEPNFAKAISFQKLWDRSALTNGGEGTSFPILRYSDVLLMYAEASNEVNSGPDQSAYDALNEVRVRAGLGPLSNLDYQQFKEAVWLERRLEFTFENNRRFDLVRTNRLVEAVKAENSFNRNAKIQPYHVLLPIPQLDMDVNKALVQNPGYE